ncbi:hypothetical protein [Streptomyces aidingensis]|uniref:Phage tail protein n=1 Tax=Streptomyces aidingensis TaxID=910347 RepID=A0A1I1PXJ9_9ACTN|nr:hypothetical protein [Streptomyces aidingensis]SFD14505.1 hypothetical protein SAMN05421773_110121 [Streptomyces aidingensis]
MPDIRVEMAFGADPGADPASWTWTDVTSTPRGHLLAQQVTISLGRPDRGSETQPAQAAVMLDNPEGWLTPGNPVSPWWPDVVLGVPTRVWVRAGDTHLLAPDTAGSRARVASSAALNVAGDLDVRVEMALDRLPAQDAQFANVANELMARYNTAANARMWRLLLSGFGRPTLTWSTTGADFTEIIGPEAVPYVSGQRFALRATLDVDDGAGGHAVAFYVSGALSGPWVPLGRPVTGSGTTSINTSGAADLELADLSTQGLARGAGRWYGAELRSGIDGTVLAAADFTTHDPGTTSFTDPQGNLWEIQGDAGFTDYQRRLTGEVAEIAPSWPYGDLSDPDDPEGTPGEARVAVTVAGVLRRLSSGQPPLQSTLRRRIPSADPAPLAYWPMEDGRDTGGEAASALPDGAPLSLTGVSWAADDTLGGSAALPTMGSTTRLYGTVQGAAAGGWQAEMVYRLEALPATEQTMLRLYLESASGGVQAVRVRCSTAGIRVQALGEDDAVVAQFLFTDADALADFAGTWNRLALFSYQAGTDCYVRAAWRDISAGSYWYAGTIWAGTTVGSVRAVRGAWGSDFQGAAIGHLAVWAVGGTSSTAPGVTIYNGADDGYAGETALARMRRLAQEEGFPLSVPGDSSLSARMGPQRVATLLDLLQECADADGGILTERRTVAGLQYLPRHLLYNRPAATLDARATLDGAPASEIAQPFEPVLDDQRRRNSVTVTRTDGASALAQDPADIAQSGLRSGGRELNVASDNVLPDIAAWEVHLGTWPGMRYPDITTDLVVAPQRAEDWLSAAPGTRVQVTGLPPQHPPGGADLLMEYISETITPTRWSATAACSPAGPWTVGTLAGDDPAPSDPPHHLDAEDSVLAVPATATDGTLWVDPQTDPDWVVTGSSESDPADVPVDISLGGEVVTVTNIGERRDTVLPAAAGGGDADAAAATGHVAPDVTAAAAGLLVCCWASYFEPGTYTIPVSMTEVSQGAGSFSAAALATEALAGAGATGTRTAVLDIADAWSAVSLALPGAVTVEEALTGYAAGDDVQLTTAAGTAAGWWLLAVQAVDEDAAGEMAPPSGTGWTLAAESGGATGATSRIRAWMRRVETAGAQEVTVTGGSGITDSRVWLLTLSGTDGALVGTGQPFAASRSVNGISKSHAAGTDVRLARPMIVAL